MTTKTPVPAAPKAPVNSPASAPVPTDAAATANMAMLAGTLAAELGFAPIRPAAPAKPARPKNATDYRRAVDLAIIAAAGKIVTETVPEEFRADVARLVANQLHHLSTPALGWPSKVLPKPERSDWR